MKKKYWIGCFLGLFSGIYASHISIEGDVFYVGRAKAVKNKIMNQDNLASYQQPTACTVSSLMGHEVAFMGKFAITPTPQETLQARLTDWVNFNATYYASNPLGITFPFKPSVNTYDWVDAQSARAYYHSNFVSYDASYIYYFTPRWYSYFYYGVGGGVSYAKMDEQFKVRYYNDDRSSKYDIKTENALYGGQLLLDIGSSPLTVISWGCAIRLGINADMIQVKQYLDDANGTVMIMNSAQHTLKPSYYAELNPYIIWKPFPIASITIGYMLMYFADIASAPEQINYNPFEPQGIKHHDDQNFQGFYGGINFYF